jgi:protein disulfide-isomerase
MFTFEMKNIKTLSIALLLFSGLLLSAQKKESKKENKKETKAEVKAVEALSWETNLQKANEISQKTKKPIFAMFTGSDWCGWCKKLQADVLNKPDFISWANKNVVLLEVDFPRFKQLPPEQMQQNQGLQQSFGVPGYPTIWMFNMSKDGKTINPMGSLGYPQGAEAGKEELKFLDDATKILDKYKGKG